MQVKVERYRNFESLDILYCACSKEALLFIVSEITTKVCSDMGFIIK